MKNPFRIRTKIVEVPGSWLTPPYYIIEYRKWWQFNYRPLMECRNYPYIFWSRESAEQVARNIKTYLI